MRVAFMGTPEFAVPPLQALLDAGYDVVGVFSQPDKPRGRGHKLSACPVKALAVERGVPVFQFERLRGKDGVTALRALEPDVCVTAAFGQILSKRLLDIPRLGTLNIHASLLPKYRGPAPINWCIAMGERETGITIMYTDESVDTGDIALSRVVQIGEAETAGELSARLACLGAVLLIEALAALERGALPRVPQNHSIATHYPKLTKESGQIDWSKPAAEIARMVRGFNPWPGAYTMFCNASIKIWTARAVCAASTEPGEVILADPKKGLIVACGEGALEIITLQSPGGRQLDAQAYLRGNPIPLGTASVNER